MALAPGSAQMRGRTVLAAGKDRGGYAVPTRPELSAVLRDARHRKDDLLAPELHAITSSRRLGALPVLTNACESAELVRRKNALKD